MFHFFRRIRQELLSNNKYQKYLLYAIGEIALVMIGILLALQVNNWNERRKEQVVESQVLQELKEDMEVNLERLDFGIRIMSMQRNQISKALSLIENHDMDQDSIRAILFPLHNQMVATFDPVTGSIQDILNSDKLRLIENKTLRRKISDWPGLIEDIKEEERKILHLKQNSLKPYMDGCCPRGKAHSIDIEKLVSDFKFENILLSYDEIVRVTAKDYVPVKEYIAELIDLINQEL